MSSSSIEVSPCHVFNPPPQKTTLQAKLLKSESNASSSNAPAYEFMLQLPRQGMRAAMRILPEGAGPACFHLLPATAPDEVKPSAPAPVPAPLQTAEGESVPALSAISAHVARPPSLPADDGLSSAVASSRRDTEFGLPGPGAAPPTGVITANHVRGARLDCDSQPDGTSFVMRDDPRNECAAGLE